MENMDLVFAALQSGSVDAVAGHESVVRQYMETTSGTYSMLEEALLSVEVGVAFEKGQNQELKEKLEQALQEMKEDGTLEKILENYGINATSTDGGETS
jgi:polar amino acid transport system substrate-binding protein